MANYNLECKLVDGNTIVVQGNGQPEDLNTYLNKMLKMDWNVFSNEDGSFTAIHMPMVSSVKVTKM